MRLVAVTAAALALAGCGAARTPETTLTAHGSRSEVTIGDPVTISGVVRRGGDPASLNVELRASTAPLYAATRRVARTRADSHGEYGFVVRPRINTAYTIATTEATRHVVVFAAPRYDLSYTRAGAGAIRIAFTVDHPRDLVPTARQVFFYAGRKGVGELALLGHAELTRRSPTRAVASATLAGVPAGPIDAFACLRTEIARGYGAPPVRRCGKPRLAR